MAKELGARRQPNSGATPWAKEDMKDEYFLYQHKEIFTAKSHSVKIADLEELRHNAIDEGLDPCYVIEYDGKRWYMVSEKDFVELKATKWQL